jgi:8-oxo-dGTP pyrophosphatase MutT (NUDIX family)
MKQLISKVKVHEKEPTGFTPQVQVVACYIEIEGKSLWLQSGLGKSAFGKWGVPAGKLEKGETLEQAALRELFEETGISLQDPSQMQHIHTLYVRTPETDFTYHVFKVDLEQIPEVCLSDEHQSYKWASLQDLEKMPLIDGAREALAFYHAAVAKNKQLIDY